MCATFSDPSLFYPERMPWAKACPPRAYRFAESLVFRRGPCATIKRFPDGWGSYWLSFEVGACWSWNPEIDVPYIPSCANFCTFKLSGILFLSVGIIDYPWGGYPTINPPFVFAPVVKIDVPYPWSLAWTCKENEGNSSRVLTAPDVLTEETWPSRGELDLPFPWATAK